MAIRHKSRWSVFLAGMVGIVLLAHTRTSAAEVVQLSPARVVELARQQSVAVKASDLQLKVQERAVQSAFASFLPTVSANGSVMHVDQWGLPAMMAGFFGMPPRLYSVGLTVTQPLFLGGRTFSGYRLARHMREGQRHTLARTTDESALTALTLYWTYAGLLEGLATAQETRTWFEHLVSDQQRLLDNGMIIELDLLNTKLYLGNTRLAEQQLGDAIATMAGNVLLFLGLATDGSLEIDTSQLQAPQPPFEMPSAGAIEDRLNTRDDVLALKRQLDVVRRTKAIQAGAYLPAILGVYSLGGTNQYTGMDSLSTSQSIGVTANWTLWDWGKNLREVQKTKCQAELLQLQLDNLREQVRLTILELARKVLEARAACDIAAEDLANARKALDISQKKYDVQAIANTDLLNARNQLSAKTAAYAQARINAILALEEYRVAPLSVAAAPQPGAPGGQSGMGQ